MHRVTIAVSAPNIHDLTICQELATNAFVVLDEVDIMAYFTFEFADKPDYLLEQAMGQFDIVRLEEDPRFEHCNIESVKEYPCEA